jgi:serine protease Do
MTKSKTEILKLFSIALSLFVVSSTMAATDPEAVITPDHFPIDTVEIDRAQRPLLTSYAEQLAKVKDSVVAVYTAKKVRRYADPREEMLRQFFGLPPQDNAPGNNEENLKRVPFGQGSGVIISEDGYILTNNHVISDHGGGKVDEVYVTLSGGEEFEATIVGFDEKTDIAVLKIDADKLPVATMADSDNLQIGDIVFAIGNPMGVGKTVTMGIISATSRDLDILGDQGYESFIQTDAAINLGNSGGALIDANGRLIGINTAIISQSGGNIGIGFAVPIKLARSILISLATNGEVRRGLLGVVPGKIDANLAESFGLESTEGAIINQVTENLPASEAGIKVGDIVLKIDGQKVKDHDHLRLIIAGYLPGTEVNIKLLRDGKKMNVPVKLADFDDPYGTGLSSVSEILPGVETQELNSDNRSRYDIPTELNGIVISKIELDSPYSRTLIEGLLILEINGEKVESVNHARERIKPGINRLYVYRKGSFGFVGVKVLP